MPDDDEHRLRKAGKAFRVEGLAFAIPMVLLGFPLGGALLGKLAADYFEQPWLIAVGVLLGLVLGIRECIRLVKQLNRAQK